MSDVNKKYVDYAGLSKYDELIKGQILSDAANAANTKVATLDTQTDVTIASESSGVVTLKAGIKEVDGIIAQGTGSDITLAKAATTGAAEDISYSNTIGGTAVTNVDDALDALATASAGGVASKTVYLNDESAGQSDYAKVYKLYQGSDSSDMTNNTLVGTINVPKDKVVQSGSVVDIVFKASDDTLHEGTESGTDVTELIKGSTTPTAADAGKYIKLVLQNVTDPLYIAASDLVDVYTGGSTAEVIVSVSGGTITATIDEIAASKITHNNSTVEAALATLEGNSSTAGSVAKAEADAKAYADGLIAALDTSSDVAIASHNASTGVVTIKGSIAETDGVIAAGSADNITFTPVSTAEIQALFSSVSA